MRNKLVLPISLQLARGKLLTDSNRTSQWRTEEGGGESLGVQTQPPPQKKIPTALQNRAKLNPIVKIVKNC